MNFRKPAVAIWTFAIFTAIGVFFAVHQHLDDVLFHSDMPISHRFVYELAGSWSAMLMVPFLNWVTLRYPIRWSNFFRIVGIHVVFTYPLYTIGHTALNSILRFLLAPVVAMQGVTTFDMLPEFWSEAANDIVYCGMLIGTLYLINHFIETQELEKKLVQANLENLRLQLQPHFLFNTLNAISTVMYEDVQKADRMIAQLSDFMRAVLDSGGVHEVRLDEELSIERMYVDIMKTRLEYNLSLQVNVAQEARNAVVPFMILQPLLENSIRHGMGGDRTAIDLGIDVRRVNGSTEIRVSDDGSGFNPGATPGIGLSNVRSRLEHMYGDKGTFTIAPRAEGGTLATVRIPFAEQGA